MHNILPRHPPLLFLSRAGLSSFSYGTNVGATVAEGGRQPRQHPAMPDAVMAASACRCVGCNQSFQTQKQDLSQTPLGNIYYCLPLAIPA